ncbi:uncharacterized protein LOC133187947 [Saccostrea echinata]|uniref:uncharacterized protein LOC133187947 n=1 Tax=Saccostrea echinata TaxID=191078 RepID=UPI002A8089CA|nr:uncharacterized protein LOC133187947 [Saccostrea echinata]
MNVWKWVLHLAFIFCVITYCSCLVYEEGMPKLLQHCLTQTSHVKGNITRDTAEAIHYLCTKEYLFKTPEERWHPDLDHVVNTDSLHEFAMLFKELDVEENDSHRVHYKYSSIKKHFVRVKRKGPIVRKEYRQLTKKERTKFHKALKAMKADTSDPKRQPNVYDWFCNLHPNKVAPNAHYGPAFLGFHRIMLYLFEEKLRSYDPDVFIPFWDSTYESILDTPTASVIFTEDFMGSGTGTVVDGPFKNWKHDTAGVLIRNIGNSGQLFEREKLDKMMMKTYISEITQPDAEFDVNLEAMHGQVHAWIGGSMDNLDYSPSEPLFYLHHCYVDALWEKFRDNQVQRGVDPTSYPDVTGGHGPDKPMKPFYLKVRNGKKIYLKNKVGYALKWSQLVQYQYPKRNCKTNSDCGSDVMVCRDEQCMTMTAHEYEVSKRPKPKRHKVAALPIPTEPPKQEEDYLPGWNSWFGWRRKRSVSYIHRHYRYPYRYITSHHFNTKRYLRKFYRRQNSRSTTAVKYKYSDEKTSPIYHSFQNTFTIDGVEDTSKWVYIPIIVYYRRPIEVHYDAHPIKHGHPVMNKDVFNQYHDAKYITHKVGNPARNPKCIHIGSGATKIYVKATGINYNGFYTDYALVDERQPLSFSLTDVGVRKPVGKTPSKVYISAHDPCGRSCKPRCLVAGSNPPRYKKCTGTLGVTDHGPLMYSSNIGDAHLNTYDFSTLPPTLSNKKVFLVFYCDQTEAWPWD